MIKYVLDKIHGNIKLYPEAIQIIDTCEFQRLRKIKQLGNAHYVFPGATHTRFEHSIGVYHLSGLLIENIKNNQPELGIDDRQVLLIKLAGLCHDLGHGCFSHLFDNYFLSTIIKDPEKEKFNHHEYRSEFLFKHIINKYQLPLGNEEVDFICNLINPEVNRTIQLKQPEFMYEIVANCKSGLDCDKIDYLIRDTISVGIASSFNYDKMFKCAHVIDDTICYPEDEALNIYQLFHLRFVMHKKVYQHSLIKQIDYMILDILININAELHMDENIDNVDKFITYTDNILDIIKYISENETVLTLLQRLDSRQLYRCIYESVGSTSAPDLKISEFMVFITELGIVNEIIIDNSAVNFSKKNKNPVNEIYFYNPCKSDSKFKIKKKDVSLILPTVFQELVTRIILKNNREIIYEGKETTYSQLCIDFLTKNA